MIRRFILRICGDYNHQVKLRKSIKKFDSFSFFIQAAASCYIELIIKESDNNVKLIVLDRLIALREVPAHEKVLQAGYF